jgi:pimeloyl-ACP methyl ester carboxylesterase
VPFLRVQGGMSLHYEATGDGPPLVFVHGLGSSARDWEKQLPAFRDRYRVVTFDVRGHGRSDKPPGPYGIPQFARDTAALIEHLGCAPAHVAGVSMGGMIALQLAADRPDLVRSLAVINSTPAAPVCGWRSRWRWRLRRLLVRVLGMRAVGWVLGRRLFPDDEHLRREFARRWAENDHRAYLASMRAIEGWSVRERLPEIQHPTLVLTAEHDYTSPAHKRAYAARMPDARVVVIPEARHGLPVGRPRAFNEALASFLDEVAGQ